MALNSMLVLNTIRDNAGAAYAQRIPAATLENLHQVGQAILADETTANTFVNALINKIAFSNIKSKMFKNPLAKLKSATIPYGAYVEEIFINPALDQGYDNDGTKLLKTTKPDGKAAYYGLNRQSTYPTSISEVELQRAFQSEQQFMSFYNNIVKSLYSGDNIDEFMLSKKVFGKAIDEGAMHIVESSLENPKELAMSFENMSQYFTFNSDQYCGYNLVNQEKFVAGERKCETYCEIEDQVLLIRADVKTKINYEVLASVFNMEVVDLKAMTIVVDDIPSEKYDVYAVLLDKEAIQIRDVTYKMTSKYIESSLMWNFWLHHWQYLYLSMFGNAVAFAKTKEA